MATRWDQIIQSTELNSEELVTLAFCQIEEQRNIVFLRVPPGRALSISLRERLTQACCERGLTLREAGRWATVAELKDAVNDVEWLWKDWLPKGLLSALVGEPGVGKTTLSLHLAKIMTTGGRWPDGSLQEPKPVVIVETESAQALLVRHFKEMQIPMELVFLPTFEGDMLSQPDLSKAAHRDHVLRMCDDIHPGLVIIDSIGGAHSKGENKVEEMRPLMEFLAGVARDYDCGVLANHHLRKRSEGFEDADLTVDAVRGSSVFAAFTRSLLGLSRRKGVLQLEVIKSNVAALPAPLVVTFKRDEQGGVADVTFEPMQPEKPKLTLDQACAEWLRATLWEMGKQSPKTIEEWAEAEGFKHGTLYRGVAILTDSGEFVKTGHGKETLWDVLRLDALGQDPSSERHDEKRTD